MFHCLFFFLLPHISNDRFLFYPPRRRRRLLQRRHHVYQEHQSAAETLKPGSAAFALDKTQLLRPPAPATDFGSTRRRSSGRAQRICPAHLQQLPARVLLQLTLLRSISIIRLVS